MDAPRPDMSTPSNRQTITYEWTLSCGCTLKHSMINRSHFDNSGRDESFESRTAAKLAEHAHDGLAYWFRTRLPRHQCELVSAENPNGLRPRNEAELKAMYR